jgi:hypothetical protein
MPRTAALVLAALVAVSCGDARPTEPSAVARFDPSFAWPMAWGDVPFPSDLYRDDGGAVRIGALPTPLSEAPLLGAVRDLLATRDGFCATCNVYFAIDGELDPGQLPADEARTASAGDPIVLADVDPTSPERGRLFPLRVQWDAGTRVLALRPERGFALHRSRRYAAALTSALIAADGTALAPSEIFRSARDERRSSDATVERVRQAIAPALAELALAGVDRERVVALAAFTTEDVTAEVVATRAAVQGGPALAVRLETIREGAAIDDLLGIPAEDRPGIDVPPIPATAGTRSIVHGSIGRVITGTFEAPRVVTGAGTDIGTLRRNAAGGVTAGPREPVPFLLTIPAAADRGDLPIAVAHHGFNASRTTGFATAETAARAGVAILAIDAFQHGDRAASARDQVNAMRGDLPGADGFAETEPLDVSGRVFGVLGAAPGLEGFPGYSLATLLQFVADVSSAVRLIREGELARLLSAASGGTPVRFAVRKIGFIGNSLGAVVGMGALVAEPELRAAVQNVPPGSVVETLVESPEFRPLVEAIFLPRLGVEGPFDEVDRRLIFDPIIDLARWVLEPADPLALAPYVVREPVRAGAPPEVLFQVAALDEVAAPLATASMLGAAAAGRVTRYDPAAHGMLEVLAQVSRYEPPVVPPFRRRSSDLPVENPLVAVHREIQDFLARYLAGAAS